MARGTKVAKFAHFGRGLNTADGVYGLREGYADDPQQTGSECRNVLNVVSQHRGNISRRNGCIKLLQDAHTFKDLSIVGNGSGSFALASSTAGGLYAISSSYAVTQLVAAAGLSTSAPWSFMRLPVITTSGPAYGMNGVDTPRETDGTLAGTSTWVATTGIVPNGTIMDYWENTLWVAGVAATPESIFWCETGDPLTWPVANTTKFSPGDGLPITGLRAQGSYLLVFKERGIWRVYDSTTSANTKVAEGVGTLSPDSVVSSPSGTFFLDPKLGVHLTDGTNVRRIGAQIQPLLDGIADSDLPSVSAAFVNGHYYLSAIFAGARKILDYDVELDSWWVHSPTASTLAAWDRGGDIELIGLLAGTGTLWQMFVDGAFDDDGATFEAYWSGPFHAFGDPHLRKRMNEIHVDARGAVDVYVATDFDSGAGGLESSIDFSAADTGGTFAGAGTFAGTVGIFAAGGAVGEGWLYSLGVGRTWSLTFYSASASFWEVDAYTCSLTTRKD